MGGGCSWERRGWPARDLGVRESLSRGWRSGSKRLQVPSFSVSMNLRIETWVGVLVADVAAAGEGRNDWIHGDARTIAEKEIQRFECSRSRSKPPPSSKVTIRAVLANNS